MKVLNTAIPTGLNMPTGKVGRKWTKVYIDNLGEFIELMRIDTLTVAGGTTRWPITCTTVIDIVRQRGNKVRLISNGVVVAKGKLSS